MKISIIYDVSYPFVKGGGQRRLFEVARRLVKRGYEVDWWTLKAWEGGDQTECEGIRFRSVGRIVELYARSGRRTITEAAYFAAAVARHRECLRADRVHCGVFPVLHLISALMLTRDQRRRLSVDWWEFWGEHWLEYLGPAGVIGREIERSLVRHIPNLIGISPGGVRQLRAAAGPDANVQLIHNGIDCQAIQRTQPMPDANFDLAYIGRLKNHKNVDLLIGALAFMKQKGTRHSLLVIGDGPERQKLEDLSGRLGVREQITFLGAVEDDTEAYAWLKTARLFVNPSTKEGGGSITTMEANACGLPAIVYRHPLGVDPEIVTEGLNGFWVEPVTAEALGERLLDLLASRPDDALRESCRHSAEAYDWSNAAEAYDRFFRGADRSVGMAAD